MKERFVRRHGLEDFSNLSEELYEDWLEFNRRFNTEYEMKFYPHLKSLMQKRQNQTQRQMDMVQVLASVSPLGAVSLVSMDLARTGIFQQERLEKALDLHWLYVGRFIGQKRSEEDPVVTDFAWFDYQDRETVGECLSRNAFGILNLVILAVLGFVGAYVAILRYDVR